MMIVLLFLFFSFIFSQYFENEVEDEYTPSKEDNRIEEEYIFTTEEEEENNGTIKCFGRSSHDLSVCSGHGMCIAHDNCSCFPNYNGYSCNEFECFGYQHNDTEVCQQHGTCQKFNKCVCNKGYLLFDCSTIGCFGVLYNDPKACSGKSNGKCSGPDECTCKSGYEGKICEHNIGKIWIIVVVSVSSICAVCCVVVYCCICPVFFVCGLFLDFREDPRDKRKGVMVYNPDDSPPEDLSTSFGENLNEIKFNELREEGAPLL